MALTPFPPPALPVYYGGSAYGLGQAKMDFAAFSVPGIAFCAAGKKQARGSQQCGQRALRGATPFTHRPHSLRGAPEPPSTRSRPPWSHSPEHPPSSRQLLGQHPWPPERHLHVLASGSEKSSLGLVCDGGVPWEAPPGEGEQPGGRGGVLFAHSSLPAGVGTPGRGGLAPGREWLRAGSLRARCPRRWRAAGPGPRLVRWEGQAALSGLRDGRARGAEEGGGP